MHHKNIKTIIRKQLKIEYPNWRLLTKKEKKSIANKVLNEVVKDYDFNQKIKTPISELIGIQGQSITKGIMTLDEMERFVESQNNSVLFKINSKTQHPLHIKDDELRVIDRLLDDQIINRLLSYDGYTPSMRELFPCSFLRAELLKAVKYPEVSYRKFCGDDKRWLGYKENSDYIGMDCKQNRVFIGLPLNRKQMLSHIQMCQFRGNLTFRQLVNLTVYILYLFKQNGFLGEDDIHCVDSTELAIDCQQLLAVLTIKGKKIRIYDDIDSDCGKRRKKRDKSVYVIGYRMHTLTAINPKTEQSYPLISLLAPANHHDSHFLNPLVLLGKAIGLDLKLITADEAYHDNDGTLYKESGTYLIKPPNSKIALPENVDSETMQVNCDDFCEIPMEYIGIEEECHEFKCGAEPGQCSRTGICPQFRHIAFDNGNFQRILSGSDAVQQALDIRKNGERPFNLLKNREGLEKVRVRSQHGLIARSTFTTIVTLLLEITGTRRKKKKTKPQIELPFAVNF